ncbi:uncharacterized protein LOC116768342 [Danaus plexippus]|uniref:uncharacterized protein LOC116768342 n=1 Tax=Danaus plexippus TaxID=13037 RepID=UPI002AB01BE0|nr:uncharacterized protein LOC116768342 [Danaus plexippus]
MRKFLCVFLIFASFLSCRSTNVNWASIACLVNGTSYFTGIIQEVVKEIENEVRWCNLKLDDINQFVNTSYYNWRVLGPVNYSNGFTISVQDLSILNIKTIFSTKNENGREYGDAYIEGTLRISGLKVGFDVKTNFEDSGERHFTSVHEYETTTMLLWMNRNLLTNETTSSSGTLSIPKPRDVRHVYLPKSNITEVLSRHFVPNVNAGSIGRWGREIIAPLIPKHAAKFDFPEIRFDKC